MKIKNKDGRSWISGGEMGYYIHIVNAEVEEAEIKTNHIVIKIKKDDSVEG